MPFYQVKIKEKGIELGSQVGLAKSFGERLLGLMFKKDLREGEGLIIESCNSIHTFFMRFSLDILFLDKKNCIVKIIRDLPPWRMTFIYWKAVRVLELKSGVVPKEVSKGDFVEVLCIN